MLSSRISMSRSTIRRWSGDGSRSSGDGDDGAASPRYKQRTPTMLESGVTATPMARTQSHAQPEGFAEVNLAISGAERGESWSGAGEGERRGYDGRPEWDHCRTASCGPRLVNYSSDDDEYSRSSISNSSRSSIDSTESSVPIHHRNDEIAVSNILPDHERRISKTPRDFRKPISPPCSSSSEYIDAEDKHFAAHRENHDSTTRVSVPLATFTTISPTCQSPSTFSSNKATTKSPDCHLPVIRRVIAQQGNQVRLEYYPQWVSRTWALTNMPDSLWQEWQTMKEDEESVLTYTPSIGTGFASLPSADPESEDDRAGPKAWKVLRSEVASDNDSGDYMAAMLEESVVHAIRELGSRKIDHVLAVPVEFASGSKRRAAELLGRTDGHVDIITFLGLLAKMTARERRKFDTVHVRYMGQVDPRITDAKGRTHKISSVEYLGPILSEWKSPLLGMKARSFFRDMEVDDEAQTQEDSEDDDDTARLSEYALLQRYKVLLLALLTSCPWLLHPHSHLASLIWTMVPRRQLKRHFSNTLGITLPHDWHTYMREQYLCNYSEKVQDKRSWHDLMETSLFLNKHFKDLKMAELGQRDEYITDDEGDSDAEDDHPCSGVTAANNAKVDRGRSSLETVATPASRKRTASAMEDFDAGRRTERESDDDDDDDADYNDGQAEYEDASDSEEEVEVEEEEYLEPVEIVKKPVQRCGPVKSASSKVPRRAAIVDPDNIVRGKTSKTKERNDRLAAKRRREHGIMAPSEPPTEEEWAILLARRSRQAPY